MSSTLERENSAARGEGSTTASDCVPRRAAVVDRFRATGERRAATRASAFARLLPLLRAAVASLEGRDGEELRAARRYLAGSGAAVTRDERARDWPSLGCVCRSLALAFGNHGPDAARRLAGAIAGLCRGCGCPLESKVQKRAKVRACRDCARTFRETTNGGNGAA